MKILFIGGTGNISSTLSKLVVERGHELHLLNRGKSRKHPLPPASGSSSTTSTAARRPPSCAAPATTWWSTGSPSCRPTSSATSAGSRAGPRPRPTGPVHLHQLGLGVPEAAGAPDDHRVDAAGEPLLGVLAQQDRLRGDADARPPRDRLPVDRRAPVAHLRHHRAGGGQQVRLHHHRPHPPRLCRSSSTARGRRSGR